MSRSVLPGCSILFAALLLAACAYLPVSSSGTGFELAGKTSDQIERSKLEIAKSEAQLDATLASLNRIMNPTDKDARSDWKQLVRDVASLEKQVTAMERQIQRMIQQGDIYFQKWETELATIEDATMRERSQARRSEQTTQYQRMQSAMTEARQAFDPLFADLQDMKQYLSIDVTPAGRNAVTDLHEQARQNATEVKLSTSLAVDELNRMQAALSPGEMMEKSA